MDLRISDLLAMQTELQNKHLDDWGGTPPSKAREQLLWGICELGEVIDIIKKRGDDEIMNNPETRRHFVEEMADVIVVLDQILVRMGVSESELAFLEELKINRQLERIKNV